MNPKRTELISETFKGQRAGFLVSYTRKDGDATQLNIQLVAEGYDDRNQYVTLEMNQEETDSVIALLQKMRDEVWPPKDENTSSVP